MTAVTEYQDPSSANREQPNKSSFRNFLERGRYPIEQRIEDKKRGIGRQRHPFVGKKGNWICSKLEC